MVVYSHLPKTAGNWANTVLSDITVDIGYHGLPEKNNLPIISSIRNPWAWYVSWYNFLNFINKIPVNHFDYVKYNSSFEDVLYTLINPSKMIKFKYQKSTLLSPWKSKVAELWLDNDCSFYTHLYNVYTKDADQIFRTENAHAELRSCLSDLNLLTGEIETKIRTVDKINVGLKVDYRLYYTTETVKLVADSHKEIIDRFGYTF